MILSARTLVIAALLSATLTACFNKSDKNEWQVQADGQESRFSVPTTLSSKVTLEDMRAWVQIDEGPWRALTITDAGASANLEALQAGLRVITIRFTDASNGAEDSLILAEATRTINIVANTSNSLELTNTDYRINAFDEDNDGLSNASELSQGYNPFDPTDPGNVIRPPVVSSAPPSSTPPSIPNSSSSAITSNVSSSNDEPSSNSSSSADSSAPSIGSSSSIGDPGITPSSASPSSDMSSLSSLSSSVSSSLESSSSLSSVSSSASVISSSSVSSSASSSSLAPFEVSAVAPATALENNGANTPVALSATIENAVGAVTYAWQLLSGDDAITIDHPDTTEDEASFIPGNYLANQVLTFRVTATDDNGPVDSDVSITIEADNDPPVIELGGLAISRTAKPGDTVTFGPVTYSDPDSDLADLTPSWEEGMNVPSFASFTPSAAGDSVSLEAPALTTPGSLDLTAIFRISDGDKEATQVFTVTITVDYLSPTPVISAIDANATPEESIAYELTAQTSIVGTTASSAWTYSWSSDDCNDGAFDSTNNVAVAFTPAERTGIANYECSISLTIDDASGNGPVAVDTPFIISNIVNNDDAPIAVAGIHNVSNGVKAADSHDTASAPLLLNLNDGSLTLDASLSNPVDDAITAYRWEAITALPMGVVFDAADTSDTQATITWPANVQGDPVLEFRLTTEDRSSNSTSATLFVKIQGLVTQSLSFTAASLATEHLVSASGITLTVDPTSVQSSEPVQYSLVDDPAIDEAAIARIDAATGAVTLVGSLLAGLNVAELTVQASVASDGTYAADVVTTPLTLYALPAISSTQDADPFELETFELSVNTLGSTATLIDAYQWSADCGAQSTAQLATPTAMSTSVTLPQSAIAYECTFDVSFSLAGNSAGNASTLVAVAANDDAPSPVLAYELNSGGTLVTVPSTNSNNTPVELGRTDTVTLDASQSLPIDDAIANFEWRINTTPIPSGLSIGATDSTGRASLTWNALFTSTEVIELEAIARDAANNEGAATVWVRIQDLASQQLTFTEAGPRNGLVNEADFTLTLDTSNAPGTGAITYQVLDTDNNNVATTNITVTPDTTTSTQITVSTGTVPGNYLIVATKAGDIQYSGTTVQFNYVVYDLPDVLVNPDAGWAEGDTPVTITATAITAATDLIDRYRWNNSAANDCGFELSAATSNTISLTLPNREATYSCGLEVEFIRGSLVVGTMTNILLADITAANDSPTIETFTLTLNGTTQDVPAGEVLVDLVPGLTLTLDAVAKDPENASMTYLWAQTPGTLTNLDVFARDSALETTHTTLDLSDALAGLVLTQDTDVVFTVTATDDPASVAAASVMGTVRIKLNGNYAAPVINALSIDQVDANGDNAPSEGEQITVTPAITLNSTAPIQSYTWGMPVCANTLEGGELVGLTRDQETLTFIAPQASANYTCDIDIAVNDGFGPPVNFQQSITINAENASPSATANYTIDGQGVSLADPNQTISLFWTQTLAWDASASANTDTDNSDNVTYAWSLSGNNSGNYTLSNTTGATTEIKAKEAFIGDENVNVMLTVTTDTGLATELSDTKTFPVAASGRKAATISFNGAQAVGLHVEMYPSGEVALPSVDVSPAGAAILYSSSDEAIARISGGKIVLVGAGEADIIATLTETDEYAGASASYTLAITSDLPEVTSPSVLEEGEEVVYELSGLPSPGKPLFYDSFTWELTGNCAGIDLGDTTNKLEVTFRLPEASAPYRCDARVEFEQAGAETTIFAGSFIGEIKAVNDPPVITNVTVTRQSDGATSGFKAGDTLLFAIQAQDPEGALTASELGYEYNMTSEGDLLPDTGLLFSGVGAVSNGALFTINESLILQDTLKFTFVVNEGNTTSNSSQGYSVDVPIQSSYVAPIFYLQPDPELINNDANGNRQLTQPLANDDLIFSQKAADSSQIFTSYDMVVTYGTLSTERTKLSMSGSLKTTCVYDDSGENVFPPIEQTVSNLSSPFVNAPQNGSVPSSIGSQRSLGVTTQVPSYTCTVAYDLTDNFVHPASNIPTGNRYQGEFSQRIRVEAPLEVSITKFPESIFDASFDFPVEAKVTGAGADVNYEWSTNHSAITIENLNSSSASLKIAPEILDGIERGSEAGRMVTLTLKVTSNGQEVTVNKGMRIVLPFVTRWKTDATAVSFITGSAVIKRGLSADNELIIGTTSFMSYDYSIDWGDSSFDQNVTGDGKHTYTNAGTYTVKIIGDFRSLRQQNGGTRYEGVKLIGVDRWGDESWRSMDRFCSHCFNLIKIDAVDVPDLSNTESMLSAFFKAEYFEGGISGWDVSNVSDFRNMFSRSLTFNEDISGWITTNAEKMQGMFSGAKSFNQDLNSWDISNVESISAMFSGASSFNGNISDWVTSSVKDLEKVFAEATSFNGDISGWDTSSVIDMEAMFDGAVSFDRNLESWNISSVVDTASTGMMRRMFRSVELSIDNYDKLLISWSTQGVSDIEFDGGDSQYSAAGKAARDILIANGWTITDGGPIPITPLIVTNQPKTQFVGNQPFILQVEGGNANISFSSNNASVASVDSVTGEVTMNGAGSAVITVTRKDGEKKLIPITVAEFFSGTILEGRSELTGDSSAPSAKFDINIPISDANQASIIKFSLNDTHIFALLERFIYVFDFGGSTFNGSSDAVAIYSRGTEYDLTNGSANFATNSFMTLHEQDLFISVDFEGVDRLSIADYESPVLKENISVGTSFVFDIVISGDQFIFEGANFFEDIRWGVEQSDKIENIISGPARDPDNPFFSIDGLDFKDGLLYVSTEDNPSIEIYDRNGFSSATSIGRIDAVKAGRVLGIDSRDNLYAPGLSDDNGLGLGIYDVSDPSSPVLEESYFEDLSFQNRSFGAAQAAHVNDRRGVFIVGNELHILNLTHTSTVYREAKYSIDSLSGFSAQFDDDKAVFTNFSSNAFYSFNIKNNLHIINVENEDMGGSLKKIYSLTWAEGEAQDASCEATFGSSCEVTNQDYNNKMIEVTWTAPKISNVHREIMIHVGSSNFTLSARDYAIFE